MIDDIPCPAVDSKTLVPRCVKLADATMSQA